MAKRSAALRLDDMIEAAGCVREVLGDLSIEALEADWQRHWLLQRGIEIISEASRHLPPALKARHPEIPWQKVAAIGNVLRHVSIFGPPQRLAAWAGVCPANHVSAGKQNRRGNRKGDTFLKAVLVTAAVSPSQAKGTYLRDKFHRLKVRMGTKKAAMAVGHKILVAIFHMLQRGIAFVDLGGPTA